MSVTPLKTVGHATTRIDARQRVTGKATYSGDVQLPGMLFARVLRSPHPHARIVSIDTGRAEALAGVVAVVTGADAATLPARVASLRSPASSELRSGGRVVEGARLESEYTPKAYRGFESLPLRHPVLRNPER